MKKVFVKGTLCLLCTVFVIFLSCGGSKGKASSSAESSKVVNIVISENILRLDPHSQTQIPGYVVCDMSYDTLVRSDHSGNYSPMLATEWSVSPDSLVWTFKLKEGVKFHDGEPFNADDVVASFQRLIDQRSTLTQASTSWTLLEKVEKKGDYLVAITMKEPFGAMLLSLESTYMIPDEAYAKHGNALFTDQIMTGTGPWVFDEWIDGQYVHYTKNTEYWAGNNSKYDEVYLRFVLEPSTAIAGQLSGDIDAYVPSSGIVSDLLSLYNGHDNIDMVRFDSDFLMYMGFQCRDGSVFSDPKVRKAFSMAIDRQEIIDNVLEGGALPSGILPNGTMGYDPACPVYEFDPAEAKALLASSSYKGQPIKLSSNVATRKPEEQLLAISEMVNAVGFNTSIEIVEGATLFDMRTTGKYDVFMVSVVHQGGDPFAFINFRIMNDAHSSNYHNQALNNMILASNVELDQVKRSALFTKINEVVRYEYAPMIMLSRMEIVYAINKGVTGIDYYPDGFYYFRHVGQ
jgi:peptide/nickel transport system substrate-binding protein